MRKHRGRSAAHKAAIKLGATYRDRKGTVVTAVDFEYGPRGRTGRVIVCGADEMFRFARRWCCHAADLVEAPEQGDLLPIPPSGGPQP